LVSLHISALDHTGFHRTTVDSTLTALIRLQPVSIQEIADRICLAKANLIAAMNNRRSLPEKARDELRLVLGLDTQDALRADVVHVWRVRDAAELSSVLEKIPAPSRIWRLKSPGATVAGDEVIALLASPTNKLQTAVMAIMKIKKEPWEKLAAEHPEQVSNAAIEISDHASLWHSGVPRAAISYIAEQALKSQSRLEPTWEEIITLANARGLTRSSVWEWVSKTEIN